MWALPQRYEKATATLWKHDRYLYRNAAVMALRLRYDGVTVTLRWRYGSDPITLRLRFQNFSVTLALA